MHDNSWLKCGQKFVREQLQNMPCTKLEPATDCDVADMPSSNLHMQSVLAISANLVDS